MTEQSIPQSEQKQNENWIAITVSVLVGLLAFGAFALSYDALRELAVQAGITGFKSYVWPLLIDFALIVFSLAIVRSEQLRESVAWSWGLVAFFVVATIIFNVLHSIEISSGLQRWLYPVMAAIAPISFVLAFETLMSQLRHHVNRNNKIKNVAELTITADRLQERVKKLATQIGELTREAKTYQAGVGALRSEKMQGEQVKAELAALQTEYQAAKELIDGLAEKQAQAKKLVDHLAHLQGEIGKAESKLNELSQQTENTFSEEDIFTAYKLGQNPNVTGKEVAEGLGRTSATFGNNLKSKIRPILNGAMEHDHAS